MTLFKKKRRVRKISNSFFMSKQLINVKNFQLKSQKYSFNKNRLKRKFSFKMGFSHRVGLFEPYVFRLLIHKKASDFRRKRFYFCSVNLPLLKELSLIMRYLKGINIYKFRGMKFLQEDVQLRIGKSGRL